MSETSVQDTDAKKEKKKSSAGSVILLILIYAVIYLVCSRTWTSSCTGELLS